MNSSSSKKTNNTLDMVKMGKHIAELRKRKGYTQKKLGEILDISDKTISKWELGFIAPDITLINALAIALDVTIEEILKGESIPDEQKLLNDQKDNVSSNNLKNKKRNKFIFVMILIICVATFSFFIHNYNRWELIKIEGKDSEFHIGGYILTNGRESKLIIDNISYTNTKEGTINKNSFSYLKIELFGGAEKIYSKNNDFSKLDISLDEYLNNYIIIVDYDYTYNNGEISIHIERSGKDSNTKQRNIIMVN